MKLSGLFYTTKCVNLLSLNTKLVATSCLCMIVSFSPCFSCVFALVSSRHLTLGFFTDGLTKYYKQFDRNILIST
jgi:hypothetical protein